MKRIYNLLISFIMLACALLASFFALGTTTNIAFADNENNSNEFIPGYVLSQSGHFFLQKDFEIRQNGDMYLYVNTTITITKTSSVGSAWVYWRTMGNVLIEQEDLNNENEYITISYDGAAEAKTKIQMTIFSAGASSSTQFNFILIQTPLHFANSTPFVWKNNANNTEYAPTASKPYADKLTLSNLAGTENSPIYIDLYYNGEFYGLMNNGIGYYNRLTGNQIDVTNLDFTAAGKYSIYIYDKTVYGNFITKTLLTSEYGNLQENLTYTYFDTTNSNYSPQSNIKHYSFEIKLSNTIENYWMKNIYITAKNSVNEDVVYSQTVNDSVTLKFYNITASKVAKVLLTIYHPTSSGNNIPENIVLAKNPAEINKLMESEMQFDEDGNYTIAFFDHNGNSLLPAYDETTGKEITDPETEYDSQGHEVIAEVTMFKFNILRNIRVQYRGNSAYGLEKNLIDTRTINEVIYLWYVGFEEINSDSSRSYIQGINSNEYTLQLANPDTKIEGVSNGATMSDTASLVVHGVGNISVAVTKDNATSTYTLTNGAKIPGTSEIGKYTIKIKDQMGNESSVAFSITKSLNVATLALLIIGAAILGIAVFLIVRLRTRIKVR